MPSPSVWLTPFGGSCVTGEVCEPTNRRWICIELPHSIKEGAAIALEGEWGTLNPSVLGSNPRGPTKPSSSTHYGSSVGFTRGLLSRFRIFVRLPSSHWRSRLGSSPTVPNGVIDCTAHGPSSNHITSTADRAWLDAPGLTELWDEIEVEHSLVAKTNFVGS